MTLSPTLIAVILGTAVVCFFIGWMAKGSGVNRREAELRREILEAKGSIPQLESSIRNRDTQIGRLTEELNDTNDRNSELLRTNETKERDLKGAAREVKNLTSELAAIRGHSGRDGNNVIMDGFDDDTTTETEGGSALEAQLKKTEALYEKLKSALIKRDERIDHLEAELAGAAVSESSALDTVDHAQEQINDEAHELKRRLDDQLNLVADLQNQISELNKEKVMLEELASRRSKSNRALKNASAEAEARVPQLEAEITEREQTISDREASIKRLLNDLETTREELSGREAELSAAQAQVSASREELLAVQPKIDELNQRIAQREERIDTLDQEVLLAQQNVTERQTELVAAREHIAEQEAELAQTQTTLRELEQATATLKNSIRDREFKIEAYESEVRDLKSSLSEAESTANETLELSDKRHAVVAAEVDEAQQQTDILRREIEDLQSQLEQRDQWMAKLKDSLSDRETRVSEQQERADQLMTQLDGANQQLSSMDESRQLLETQKHELEREIVAHRTKAEQAEAALEEELQAASVFKSMIADRDFKIDALESDLLSLGKTPPPEQAVDDTEAVPASGGSA